MTLAVPRTVLTGLVEVDASGVNATFYTGERFDLDRIVDCCEYGFAVADGAGTLLKHFGARFSTTEERAYVVDFATATQIDYDASHLDDLGATVVARFPGSSLGIDSRGSARAFVLVEGVEVSAGIPLQVLA